MSDLKNKKNKFYFIKIGITLFVLINLFFSLPIYSQQEKETSLSPDQKEKILLEINKKFQFFFNKYYAYTNTRERTTVIFDTKKKKVVETSKVILKRIDPYFSKPKITSILFYQKNGKKLPVKKCKKPKMKFFYQIFGDKAYLHYQKIIEGSKTIDGIECYQIDVIPLKKNKNSFVGKIFIDKKNLNLIALEGKPAKKIFAVDKLYTYIRFGIFKNTTVPIRAKFIAYVNVPIFYPHKRITIDVKISNFGLILKKKNCK